MEKELKQYTAEVEAFNSTDPEEVAAFSAKYLGSKGVLKDLFALYKTVPAKDKMTYAEAMGAFKMLVARKINSLKS